MHALSKDAFQSSFRCAAEDLVELIAAEGAAAVAEYPEPVVEVRQNGWGISIENRRHRDPYIRQHWPTLRERERVRTFLEGTRDGLDPLKCGLRVPPNDPEYARHRLEDLFFMESFCAVLSDMDKGVEKSAAIDVRTDGLAEWIFEETTHATERAYLHRFTCDRDHLQITENLAIRKLTDKERSEELSRCAREWETIRQDEVCWIAAWNYETTRTEILEGPPSKSKLGLLLAALRLHAPGAVFLRYRTWQPAQPLIQTEGRNRVEDVLEVRGLEYELKGEDLPRVQQLLSSVEKAGPRMEKLAQTFDLALRTHELPNRVAALMAVMDALYGSKRGDSITYKVCLRAARRLGADVVERAKLFEVLKYIYADVRSPIAHGEPVEDKVLECGKLKDWATHKWEAVAKVEDLARRSLREFAEAPDSFKEDALDRLLLD